MYLSRLLHYTSNPQQMQVACIAHTAIKSLTTIPSWLLRFAADVAQLCLRLGYSDSDCPCKEMYQSCHSKLVDPLNFMPTINIVCVPGEPCDDLIPTILCVSCDPFSRHLFLQIQTDSNFCSVIWKRE